ncbi:hypothetical protein [Leptolyngbya sp. NIES-2104]|nr:hypothetical protein [Leptolyngbya sp. NIES-2104]GAP98931.1 hypothetical protein NIES2104_54870 [Leptolyngbya sp. NIES-2104]
MGNLSYQSYQKAVLSIRDRWFIKFGQAILRADAICSTSLVRQMTVSLIR